MERGGLKSFARKGVGKMGGGGAASRNWGYEVYYIEVFVENTHDAA